MDHHDVQDAQIDLMREILGRGGTFAFRAFGHSMFPMILPGTEVTVGPLRSVPPPVGTILVAERAGTLVCHRLVRLTHSRAGGGKGGLVYHLRGDAHQEEDPPYDESQVMGEVEAVKWGKIAFSADFAPYRMTGGLWALFPGPAILGVAVARRALAPGKKVVETVHGRALRTLRSLPDVRPVGEGDLSRFQSRAIHLGVAWSRDRTSALEGDMAAGRTILLGAWQGDDLVGALLATTAELEGAARIEFLRLSYPRRGTGYDYVLVEAAFDRLASLGFHSLEAAEDRPLSARRLRRLGFRRIRDAGGGGGAWVRRL